MTECAFCHHFARSRCLCLCLRLDVRTRHGLVQAVDLLACCDNAGRRAAVACEQLFGKQTNTFHTSIGPLPVIRNQNISGQQSEWSRYSCVTLVFYCVLFPDSLCE